MNTRQRPVVVGVDDSAGGRAALAWAIDFATTLDVPLLAVTAIEVPQVVGRAATFAELTQVDGIRAATSEWLRLLVESMTPSDRHVDVTVRIAEGHAAHALVTESRDAQLVVVGSRGAGLLHRLLLGSVSTAVLQHARCSVLVVRDGKAVPLDRRPSVVVGYDGSPDAEAAVDWAAAWVQAHDGTLTVVAALEWPSFQGVPIVFGHIDPRHDIKEFVERAATRTGIPDPHLRTVVVTGPPASVLLERAQGAELLVVGRRGLGGFEELLTGSVSKQCALRSPCPVVVVRRT